jgi:hypothetical protein
MRTLGYNIGDTVQFTSLKPYRIIVSRIKHYTYRLFGEHVIGKEVESALKKPLLVLLFELMNLRWHLNYTSQGIAVSRMVYRV